jgi:Leucine-rich repeat (LRR) protein
MIRRIENLGGLPRLRHLNLADNLITKFEHAEQLTGIETLNLAGNQLEMLPVAIQKLTRLRTLRLARNRIASVWFLAFVNCPLLSSYQS